MISYQNFFTEFMSAVSEANRDIDEIDLIAVSKKKSSEDIRKVINFEHSSYGENQIQEVEKKWVDLKKEFPSLKLHFIGGVQSRKVKAIYSHCDVIHSLDRMKIVKLFSELETSQGISKDYFIQINTGDESQKSGVLVSEADKFISSCIENYNLNIVGLMCIPPFDEDPIKYFSQMSALNGKVNLIELSMGMSSDYLKAVEFNATYLRIGSNIFGQRG